MALALVSGVGLAVGQIFSFFGDMQAANEARDDKQRQQLQEDQDRAMSKFEREISDAAALAFETGEIEEFQRMFGNIRQDFLDTANNLTLADFAGDSLAQIDQGFINIERSIDADLARRGLTSASGVDDDNRIQAQIGAAQGRAGALQSGKINLLGARAQLVQSAASLRPAISEATRLAAERSKLRETTEAPEIVQPKVPEVPEELKKSVDLFKQDSLERFDSLKPIGFNAKPNTTGRPSQTLPVSGPFDLTIQNTPTIPDDFSL